MMMMMMMVMGVILFVCVFVCVGKGRRELLLFRAWQLVTQEILETDFWLLI